MRAQRSRMAGRGLSWSRRMLLVAGMGLAATFAVQPFASAHVAVTPDTAQPGEPALLSFRVPDERDDAGTVRLELTFPADHPLDSVTPRAMPGWTITVQKQAPDAVSSVVWQGGTIPPGTFEDFSIRIGAMPSAPGMLSFTAVQTYSDGQVVRWADPMGEGQPEPEHPAPTVTVAPVAAVVPAESASDTPARVLGGAGIVIAVGAVVVSFVRRRPGAAPAEPPVERETVRL